MEAAILIVTWEALKRNGKYQHLPAIDWKRTVLLKTEKDFCHRKEFSGIEKDLDMACFAIKTYVLELLI